MNKAELIILGCGNSMGVPQVGNGWGACDPLEPRNRRMRASVAIKTEQTTLVVDTGPDFRHQMNREDLRTVTAVLYSHAHGDHINGIEDLRAYFARQKGKVPIYAEQNALEIIQQRFFYLFKEDDRGFYPSIVAPRTMPREQMGQPMTLGDVTFVPFLQDHGTCDSVGFRFGNVAYSTDVIRLNDDAFAALEGVDTWIIDAAGYHDPNQYVHADLGRIYAFNERVKARQVVLTHMPANMDYMTLCRELPEGYIPAFDGMRLPITL